MKHSTLVLFIIVFSTLSSIVVGKNVETKVVSNLAVVSALGIDLEDGQYALTVQVINPSSTPKNSSDQLGAVIYKQKGKNLTQALQNLHNTVSRTLSLDDIRVVALQDKVLEGKGLNEILDFFIVDPTMSSNMLMIVSKDQSANKLLRVMTPIQKVSANRIEELLKTNEINLGHAFRVYPLSIKNDLLNGIKDIAVPYITISGNIDDGMQKGNIAEFSPKSLININGMAIFQKDKLIGFLDENESKIYSMSQNKFNHSFFIGDCPSSDKEFFSVRIMDSKVKIKHAKRGEFFDFKVKVKVQGELVESQCSTPFDYQNLRKFEEIIAKEIQTDFDTLIRTSKENNSDFIGFGKSIFISDYHTWKKTRKNWKQTFKDSNVSVEVKAVIPLTGDTMSIK